MKAYVKWQKSMTDDLYNRLTSRKFIVSMLVMIVAFIGYFNKEIDFNELMRYVTIIAGIYGVVEAVPDAAKALTNSRAPLHETIVDEDAIAEKVFERIQEQVRREAA